MAAEENLTQQSECVCESALLTTVTHVTGIRAGSDGLFFSTNPPFFFFSAVFRSFRSFPTRISSPLTVNSDARGEVFICRRLYGSQDMAEVYEGAGVSGVPFETLFRVLDSIRWLPLEMALVMGWREWWVAVKHSRQRFPTK